MGHSLRERLSLKREFSFLFKAIKLKAITFMQETIKSHIKNSIEG